MADNAILAFAQAVMGGTSLEEGTIVNAAFSRLGLAITSINSSGVVTWAQIPVLPTGGATFGSNTLSAADVLLLNGITAGTASASKAAVLDAQKSLDTLGLRTDLILGGTGVSGAAATVRRVPKTVTGLADNVATAIYTVTVPNASHSALIRVDVLAILGAGGAIGAGEACSGALIDFVVTRTAGVAAVTGASSQTDTAAANVVGGQGTNTLTVAASSVSGAVGATNTFTINVTYARGAGTSTNHVVMAQAALVNLNASGITIA